MGRYDWTLYGEKMRDHIKEHLCCLDVIARHAPSLRSTKVRRMAHKWRVHCPRPEHEDKTPSCEVESDKFHCYGCQAGGDVFDLLGLIHGTSFVQTLSLAQDLLGIDAEQEKQAFMASAAPEHWSPRQGVVVVNPPTSSNSSHLSSPPVEVYQREEADALHELRSRAVRRVWRDVLKRLSLEEPERRYLTITRGLDPGLIEALGFVSCSYERLHEVCMEVAASHELDTLLASGLYFWPSTLQGDTSDPPRSQLRIHPWLERMIIFPYVCQGVLETLRFRTMRPDPHRYQGATYLSLRHARLTARQPYLATSYGLASMPHVGRHNLLWVNEKEFDTITLVQLGRSSIGMPGAGTFRSSWCAHWPRYYDGVILCADDHLRAGSAAVLWRDRVLEALTQYTSKKWVDAHVLVTSCQGYGEGIKDINDLHTHGVLEAFVLEHEARLREQLSHHDLEEA